MLRTLSILGLVLMAGGLLGLWATHSLFSAQPVVIGVQVGAVALVLWARVTFGKRSFHAAANPTAGGLVTTGPYRYIRHPIYTAACLFGLPGILAHLSWRSAGLGLLLVAGGLIRMLCEERLVVQAYPEYREYASTTKRMLPGLF